MGAVDILRASAGSGKTYQLTYEWVRTVVTDPPAYRHLLAVTFTNKATEEMKNRILHKIDELASGRETDYLPRLTAQTGLDAETIRRRAEETRGRILHDFSRFAVMTIDRFFQRIVRAFVRELGIDLNFNLELQTDTLLGKAADALLEQTQDDPRLRRWVGQMVDERIDDNRNWRIKEELVGLGRELFKDECRSALPGPSAEALQKLVTLTTAESARIRQQIVAPAREALELLAANGLTPEDLAYGRNGAGGYLQRTAEGELGEPTGRATVAAKDPDKWATARSPRRTEIAAIAPQLSTLLDRCLQAYSDGVRYLNSADLLRENYRHYALLADLHARITEQCAEENILPISETNHLLARLVADNDTPFIYEKAGNQFSHYMIDEFQDTSQLQWNNFVPLLRNAAAQTDRTAALLVGDVKQSIYRWRGGDWRILAEEVPERLQDTRLRSLDENFRSLPLIVRFNNALIGRCVEEDTRRLAAVLDEALAAGAIDAPLRDRLAAMLPAAYAGHEQRPRREGEGYVTLTVGDERDSCETALVERIEELQARGYAPGDIAVLVRSNSEAARVAELLLARKSVRPDSSCRYDVITQDALTVGSAPVCVFVIACMRLALTPDDPVRLALYNRSSERPLDAAPDAADAAFLHTLSFYSPQEAFERIVLHYRLDRNAADTAYLQALHQQTIAFCNSRIADLALFLQWWDETGSNRSLALPERNDAITVMTIHKSKGLDFPVVLLPYCNWPLGTRAGSLVWAGADRPPFDAIGRIPVGYKKSMARSYYSADYYRESTLAHIDNLNILYVALTRAARELHLFPVPGGPSRDSVDRLIGDALVREGDTIRIGNLTGQVEETASGTRVQFGTPTVAPERTAPRIERIPARFGTSPVRIGLKFPARRYLEEGERDLAASPRNFGVLMHRVFETAETTDDIRRAIDTMRLASELSESEAAQLDARIGDALRDKRAAAWFDGRWERIMTENEIVTPGTRSNYRPDRVMIAGSRAVVVDYKFGRTQRAEHASQVRGYLELLRQMGYERVEGYLWYVGLGTIEPVAE